MMMMMSETRCGVLWQISVDGVQSVVSTQTKKKAATPLMTSRHVAMVTSSVQRLTPKILTREVAQSDVLSYIYCAWNEKFV